MRSSRTSSDAARSGPRAASTELARRSWTSGAACATVRQERRGKTTPWSSSSRPRKAWPPWSWLSPIRAAGSITRSGSPPTGRSSRRPARRASPSASSSPIRRASSASTRRSTGPSSRTSTAWQTSWPASDRPGRPANDRPTMPSASASTRAKSSAASTPDIAPWARSSPTRLAAPLDLDFYIRLPGLAARLPAGAAHPAQRAPDHHGAPTPARPRCLQPALGPLPLARLQSRDARAHRPRPRLRAGPGDPRPAAGVGTARAIARAYGAFATGGHELGLRPETAAACSARGPAEARLPGRVPEGRGAVLARLHEADSRLAIRRARGVRRARCWRLARLRRPGDGHRLRLCDQPDRHQQDGDPRDVALRRAMPVA